jgi:hypothetical protein
MIDSVPPLVKLPTAVGSPRCSAVMASTSFSMRSRLGKTVGSRPFTSRNEE